MILSSQERDQLYTALAQAQVEFPTIRVNRKAFKNEYADLYAILKPIYPVLAKYGLSIHGWSGLHALQDKLIQLKGVTLAHKSGQYITNPYIFETDPIKGPQDQLSHKTGGALTYFARYYAKDILGAIISDDPEDDDAQPSHPDHKPGSSYYISHEQLEDVENSLKGHPAIYESLLKGLKITTLEMIPKDKYISIMETIRTRKTQYSDTKK